MRDHESLWQKPKIIPLLAATAALGGPVNEGQDGVSPDIQNGTFS